VQYVCSAALWGVSLGLAVKVSILLTEKIYFYVFYKNANDI
jgi:hypothetical protein